MPDPAQFVANRGAAIAIRRAALSFRGRPRNSAAPNRVTAGMLHTMRHTVPRGRRQSNNRASTNARKSAAHEIELPANTV
jgi:hypothetical protein